jgi:L-fuculose-phosphate aldolase
LTAAGVDAIRREVAVGCRVLAAAGQDDFVWGHVSARDPEGRGVWMKRSGIGLEEVGPDDVLLVDAAGEVLEGDGRRHIEYPIHTELQAARPEVGAVAHTHAEHAVALSAAGVPLRPVSHAATMFVPPDVPRFTETTDLIRTPELGRALAACIADHIAVLLVNHGIATVGDDVPTAVVRAVVLDQACTTQLLVAGHGGTATWTTDAEALSKRQNIFSPAAVRDVWDFLVRRLGARGRP